MPARVRLFGVNVMALGVVLGAAYGVWNMIETARDPLADDTPTSLLLFYGPMFALWGTAGFAAARRTGRTLDGVAIGATLALVTFSVFWVANLVRINVFFDAVLPRADWRNMLAKFQTSGFTDLRTFVIYDYLKDAPLKLFSATLIGAITGTIGAFVASSGRPLRNVTLVVIALSAGIFVPEAEACSCAISSPCNGLGGQSAVFTGRVVSDQRSPPGAPDKPTPITLGAGEHRTLTPLVLPPPLPEVSLTGCVVWPGARPAPQADVQVSWGSRAGEAGVTRNASVDSRGCFTMQVHEGYRYRIFALAVPTGSNRAVSTVTQELVASKGMQPAVLVLTPQR